MFERYTEKARRVIFFARYEASTLGSSSIEASHLVLGLLREDPDLWRDLLRKFPNYTTAVVRAWFEPAQTSGKVPTSMDLPLTPDAVKSLQTAAEEASRRDHRHIAPFHLLLGILRASAEPAAATLISRGITYDHAASQWSTEENRASQGAPVITNPVVRTIGSSNIERTTAFYRDVLGFQIVKLGNDIMAISGPAQIVFGAADFAPGEWDHPRPIGSAMIFFQTSNLDAMRAAILERGGEPSQIEKVNWIKQRVFSVLDPDGHTLWFAESYDSPDAVHASPMLQQALPELPFTNIPAAVDYYRDVLGFKINYQQDDLGVMDRDQITILLIQRSEKHTGIGSFEVYIENADRLYAELRDRGANLQGEPVSHPWGLRDFRVLDLEGNRITFAQRFE
jgi:catechol 2,3-dioxygenase-like lactoylglutathione lyase family enzyme